MGKMFTSANFEAEVLKSEIPVLVDFYADWCGPCKLVGPIVEQLTDEYAGRVKVGKVDVDESTDLAMKYGVMSVPTFILFRHGEIFRKTVGAQNKKSLVQALNQAL